MSNTFMEDAQQEYADINQQWLKFHYHVLHMCVAISIAYEVIMYLIIRFTGEIFEDEWVYCLKYIFIPAIISFILVGIARTIMNHKQLSYHRKSYALSIIFMLAAFNLCFMHSGFISVLYVVCIPILMTIMYEEQRLTVGIFLMSIISQLVSAFTKVWDPYKDFNYQYMMDLIIVIMITCIVYLVSMMMIKFALMKKRVIIQRDAERQQLKIKIQVDSLTKVGNKSALMQQLTQLSGKEKTFYLAMLDIDDFKMINDHCGHLFGDEVLKELGTCLKEIGNESYSYRYGGDEFCVIFLKEHQQVVEELIQDLQMSFAYTCSHMKDGFEISISAGIAKAMSCMDAIALLQQADDALYKAKRKRKAKQSI